MKTNNIIYDNRITKQINVNMNYDELVKLHNIKTSRDKIAFVRVQAKPIKVVYVLDKKGNILETVEE